MAAAVPFMMLAAAGIQAVSSIQQGRAAQEAAEFNAARAEENAGLARAKAADDERKFRIYSRKALADMRTGYAASGVTLEGSANDVLTASAANAEYDALKIREGGEIAARGYRNDATYARMRGNAAATGGYLSAAGYLLGGAGRYAGYGGGGNSDNGWMDDDWA